MDNQVQTLTFNMLPMTIGVLPSSYVDSMSYYETLLWLCNYLENTVIPTVNNNGEAVEELQSAYITLHDYVEHYFDNLDVQEEINNKLDQMTEDGTLTNLIKAYVDPIYEAYESAINLDVSTFKNQVNESNNLFKTQVNGEIDNLTELVEASTSGSPRGAYATLSDLETADPNHNYIYVVIEDGYWYYYNTSTTSWTRGGEYQADVSDETINDLIYAYNYAFDKHTPINIFHTTAEDTEDGYALNISTGVIGENSDYYTFDNYLDVESSADYYYSVYNSTTQNYFTIIGCLICYYDANKDFISGIAASGSNQPLTTPSNCKFIRISIMKAYYDPYLFMVSKDSHPTKYSEWFATYYTLNPDLTPQTIYYNDITVDANGGGDYTTLQAAFTYIENEEPNYYKRYNVHIKEGNYNTGSHFQPSDLNNPSVDGLFVPSYTYLIGEGNRDNIVIYCSFAEGQSQQYISTLNLHSSCGLENLRIEGTRTRYVIHVDSNETEATEQIIKNCYIKGYSTYLSVVYGSGNRDNAHWKFIDTIFDGLNTGINNQSATPFTVHNSLGGSANRYIDFINCRFLTTSSYQAILFKTLAYRNADPSQTANNMLTYVSMYGNKLGDGGFKLMEENNSVYGSGCMFYVSGYGNKNDSYEIIVTDGQDYSDRVNLI